MNREVLNWLYDYTEFTWARHARALEGAGVELFGEAGAGLGAGRTYRRHSCTSSAPTTAG